MASPPARRPPSEDEPVEDEPVEEEPVGFGPVDVGEREPFGPLELERHVKADGRTLILYTRSAETGPAPPSAAATPVPAQPAAIRGSHP